MSPKKKTVVRSDPTRGDQRSVRILVVDDDPAGRLAVSRVLDRAGYKVEAAVDAASALDEFGRSDFDLIISDVRMPDRSGLDLLEEVHRLKPNIPFLLLSAGTDRDSKSLAMRLGASDFLEKPVRRETLIQTINRALGA